MMTFYAVAALLAVLAAVLLARPLWWPIGSPNGSTLSDTVRALSVQLRQLGELHRAGALTDQQYAQSKGLVESKLLEALAVDSNASGTGPSPVRPSRSLTAGLIAFVFVTAAGGYLWLGSPSRPEHGSGGAGVVEATGTNQPNPDADAAPHALSDEKVRAMIDQLAERLRAKPEDAPGWLMLARSYVVVGQSAQAVGAFKQAARLRPEDPDLWADYADALAMTNNRSLAGEPLAMVERALKLDAKNAKALALAGSAAFDRKDYKGAIDYWERLVRAEPATGPFAQQVQGGIAEARQLAGLPPGEKPPAEGASTAKTGRVSGTVVLTEKLRDRVKPDDTVFIFARPIEGQRMPLAILRKQVHDLPLQFTLDDSLAMSSDAKISDAQRVVVSARISRSGNAMAQAGDLQAIGSTVAVGSSGLTIEINQEVMK